MSYAFRPRSSSPVTSIIILGTPIRAGVFGTFFGQPLPSEMMAFTITEVLGAAYLGVHMYFCVPGPRLYPAPDDLSDGGLGRLFRLPPALWGFIWQFGTEKAVRGSCVRPGVLRGCPTRWSVSSGSKLRIQATVGTARMTPASSTIPLTGATRRSQLYLALAAILYSPLPQSMPLFE